MSVSGEPLTTASVTTLHVPTVVPAVSTETTAASDSATASTQATVTVALTATTATFAASSIPRPTSPQCYKTASTTSRLRLGEGAQAVAMNVYATLREECPSASYTDIVRQTAYLTGVSFATIFRWKKLMAPPGLLPGVPVVSSFKRGRKKKSTVSSLRNGARNVPKGGRKKPELAGTEPRRKKRASKATTTTGKGGSEPDSGSAGTAATKS